MKKILLKIQACFGIVPKPTLEKKIPPYKTGHGDYTCEVCKNKYTYNMNAWFGTCSLACTRMHPTVIWHRENPNSSFKKL